MFTSIHHRAKILALLCCAAVLASCSGAPVIEGARTLVVALDGSGQYTSIQEAIDAARKGDVVHIKAGAYPENVTVHSKDRIKIVGDGAGKVIILGRDLVGSFHIGKWPYGATNIEISGLTIQEHGGLAMGIFNGKGILLRDVQVNGKLFGQQVSGVRIERCSLGGSETTGVQFADSQAVLAENFIHDNDHGVTVAGKSDVRLERNVITRSLFEGVVVTDRARAVLVSNTIVKNGGGALFLGTSQIEATGNIIGLNVAGVTIAPSARVSLSYNAFFNKEDYLREGPPPVPAPDLKPQSDVSQDPRFVDPSNGDFRLQPDSPLKKVGGFDYLGAFPPASGTP
ncbi:MAG TPA: pectinesterase family protein [Nitrospiraceae bacterium]